jgi:hypothetical protein
MNNQQIPLTLVQPRRTAWFLAAIALLSIALLPGTARAQQYEIDTEALQLLSEAMDYLGGLNAFSVDTSNALDEVLDSGQKIQFDFDASVTLQRPNKMRGERRESGVDQSLIYDGSTVSLYNTGQNYYATSPAPETIEGMLDFSRLFLGVIAPASDLLYRDAVPLLMKGVYSAMVIGEAEIGGVACTQLAFSRPDVDFQIWIPTAGAPLPCKYVVTDKTTIGYPNTVAVMSNWNTSPKISATTFKFVPPQGAKATEFMQVDSGVGFIQ